MYLSIRPLITNLTCPGDSSLYVEWAQPDTFYHGVDKYNLFIRYRSHILTSILSESRYCSFLIENMMLICPGPALRPRRPRTGR